jgi:hypothetical protein
MTNSCLKCGKTIESGAAPGRPKSYCSVGCRRSAEHEIRRLSARIANLEERAMHLRLAVFTIDHEEGTKIAEEIRTAEDRLRHLFEDAPE